MRNLLLLFTLLLAGCAAHTSPTQPPAPPPEKDWTITINFSYDFTDVPICSVTVTSGCANGFLWGYMNGTTPVQLKSSPVSICTGSSQPQACTDSTTGLLPINTSPGLPPYVAVTYIDSKGNTGVTSPISGPPVSVGAANATNVTMTIK